MYDWLKEHMSSTGGGINVHGGLGGHSEQWWIDNCKGNLLECKKFKWEIPDYVSLWHEMFDNTSVDGSSASVPGDGAWDPQQGAKDARKDDAQEAGQEDDTFRSPVSSGGKKRPGSTTDTATSPEGKKSKSPMLKCFNNFISIMHADNSKEKEVAVAIEIQEHIVQIKTQQKLLEEQKRIEDIDKCMELVRAAGATDDSEEFYVALELFEIEYKRTVFKRIAPEARLSWLKRCVHDWPSSSSS
ncbi:unnamed protein product [Urochloa humidicola]